MHWPQFLVHTGPKDLQGSLNLHPPGDVNLDQLAELTAKSLQVLQPWCNAEHQSDALKKIAHQAHTYTEAIHFSISAAQQGYNVANDALTLSQSVNSGEKTKEELGEFAYSMLKLGQEAFSKAQECLNKFRNVRQVLGGLIEGAKTSTEYSIVEGKLKPLEEGIPVFEGLAMNISTYITWWNWLELKTNSQVENAGQLRIHYSAMRQKSVITKWAELKEAFVVYTEKIQSLEDTHPELFGSFQESAKSPTSSSDLSTDYIKHHTENPRPKTSRKLGGLLHVISFRDFISHFRIKQNSVIA
ncbi:hypothetical protein CPB84DRAFT_1849062 [Gymnopilus junonius]|uniref:Uncharacterized protein n=1 Tax=Gymnopilus junonius TaxID=109634 RepID=A0A9P5TK34_GYMJU|nr:hypothetical protein CPB84DRAFT_1849062 [Gymnopilus junonius]